MTSLDDIFGQRVLRILVFAMLGGIRTAADRAVTALKRAAMGIQGIETEIVATAEPVASSCPA